MLNWPWGGHVDAAKDMDGGLESIHEPWVAILKEMEQKCQSSPDSNESMIHAINSANTMAIPNAVLNSFVT